LLSFDKRFNPERKRLADGVNIAGYRVTVFDAIGLRHIIRLGEYGKFREGAGDGGNRARAALGPGLVGWTDDRQHTLNRIE
jgi:hypothetical protein